METGDTAPIDADMGQATIETAPDAAPLNAEARAYLLKLLKNINTMLDFTIDNGIARSAALNAKVDALLRHPAVAAVMTPAAPDRTVPVVDNDRTAIRREVQAAPVQAAPQ